MKHLLIWVAALAGIPGAYAQNTFKAYIRDCKTGETIPGAIAHIINSQLGNSTNEQGFVMLSNIPDGTSVIRFSAMGYVPKEDSLAFPLANGDTLSILLCAEELEEVRVSTTRSSRTIQDIPTRIEMIAGEELDEKGNMKPGDIRMLLSESTGIQTLQTSATTGNSSIRIEGMDGRYTQILRDGFPLYSGFSGGLGLLQTPPLDLKQVEIIKGSSSTLYGGGAIAGLVNLISRTPEKERDLRFLVNGTSAGGLDVNGFYGQRYGKTGLTVYAARNSSAAYDPSGTGLSAIPEYERYTLNPRLYLYPDSVNEIMLGLNVTGEHRLGGDMQYIKGNGDSLHSYFERNSSMRLSSQAELKHRFASGATLSLKNSIDHFDRTIKVPGYTFDGTQLSTFTELSYSTKQQHTEYIFGANLFSDDFRENKLTTVPLRNYKHTTAGLFVQNTWDINNQISLESGLRGDYVTDEGLLVLPRVSLLFKPGRRFSSRLGGGLGYKTPSIFTEESERIQYKNVLPVNIKDHKTERSYGVNWDMNYKTTFADNRITFSVNQLFFYTYLNDPLVLTATGGGYYAFVNLAGHIDAQGAETNIKLGYKNLKLFLGYTYTHAHTHAGLFIQEALLTPEHHTNSVLMYEVEDKWKLGLEAYYYSRQRLSDGTTGRDYWLCGFMAERIWKHMSLFINFENMLDSRQTRFGSIYSGSVTNPVFRDIYAPLDGFVVNGGIKLKL